MKSETFLILAGLGLVVLAAVQALRPAAAAARAQISGVNNNFWDQIAAAITAQDYVEGRRGGGYD